VVFTSEGNLVGFSGQVIAYRFAVSGLSSDLLSQRYMSPFYFLEQQGGCQDKSEGVTAVHYSTASRSLTITVLKNLKGRALDQGQN
jgi:hypothetical protein